MQVVVMQAQGQTQNQEDSSTDQILLNFENVDLRAVIELISKETKTNFLLDPRVRKQNITLITQNPMSRKDAYDVFLSILRLYGYGVIEAKDFVKIIPLSEVRQNEVGLLEQGKNLSGDKMATLIIALEKTKAEQMAGIIRPMIPSFGQVIAHGDSNSLIVLAPLGVLNKVNSIIDELESKVEQTIQIVPLKYATAADIIAILIKLEKQAIAKTNGLILIEDKRSNQIIISKGTQKDRNRVADYIAQLDIASKNSGDTQVIYLNYANAKDLAVLLKEVVANNKGDAKTKITQKVNITADENTNSLVVYAPSSVMREIKNTITQLDIRKAQVLVQAIIVEISDNNAAQLGVRWGVNTNSAVGLIDFTGAGSLVNLIAGNAGSANPAALGAGSSVALGNFNASGRGWGALIKALRSDSGVNILSTPSVITLDNEEASIVVGQEVPFVTGQSTQNSGNPFTTIQRKEIGLKLKVTPQINQGDAMQLKIFQEVSSLQSSARVATGASDIITAKRSIDTSVIIRDKEVLVLGGLTTQQTEQSAESIPGLSDLPFIGGLFASKQNQSEKRTLMVFIKTDIIRDSIDSQNIMREKYTRLYEEANHNNRRLGLIDKNNSLELPLIEDLLPDPIKRKTVTPIIKSNIPKAKVIKTKVIQSNNTSSQSTQAVITSPKKSELTGQDLIDLVRVDATVAEQIFRSNAPSSISKHTNNGQQY